MIGKDSSARASIREIADPYIEGYPICEYCGYVVLPGEQQKLERGSLAWHSAHCFRCYGCHREFLEGRTCHLLPNIALCDDCYPRHEFFVDEWKSLNNGKDPSIKQPRVCFLSPVTEPVPSENHSLVDIRDSGSGDSAPHENVPQYIPRQLEFTQSETPKSVRIPKTEQRAMYSSSVSTAVSSTALVDGLSEKPRERDMTPQPVPQSNTTTVGQSEGKTVEALIADAMKSAAWSPKVRISPIESELPTEAAAAGEIMEGSKPVEEVAIDEKFSVIAVRDWADVEPEGATEAYLTGYVKLDEVIDSGKDSLPHAPSITTRFEKTMPVNGEVTPDMWRQSHRALRRTSSCCEVYPPERADDEFSDNHQRLSDSCNSDAIEFNSLQSSQGEAAPEALRDADIRGSPSPVQSSTPIPHYEQVFTSNDRPPSSFREDPYESGNHSRSRTVSPEDVSFGKDDGVGEKSFRERRAIFEKADDAKRVKSCYVCQSEVLARDRFECLHKVYHLRCFRCSTCKARLNIQTFRDDGRQPYCKICFLDLKVSKNRFPRDPVVRGRVNSL